MSALYVRELVRQWATDAAAASVPPLAFYDTVNRETDPQDPYWMTAQFLGGVNEQSTYCAQLERGTFDLMFFARGGGGDQPLLQLAEPVIDAFMQSVDPSRRLQLRLAGPPEDFPAGGGVPWFVLLFPVDYLFSH